MFWLLACFFWALFLDWLERRALRRLDEKNQEEMQNFLLKQRVQRHDFNIHLMALRGMLDAGKYQECSEYFQKLLSAFGEVGQLMPLEDPAVAAMLNQSIQDARERGVGIECFIYDSLKYICCDTYEVNQILGNLIRNAVEAAVVLPKECRTVTVTLLSRRNQCIFRVENQLPPGEALDGRIFQYGYSKKEGHSGIGLAAVRRLVSRYNGTIFPEQEGNRLCMIVQLPMKGRRESGG